MQEAQEPAAEPKAERNRTLRLVVQRGVVEGEFFERVAQHPMFVRVDRIQPREHHALDVFKPRQRLGARPLDRRNRIAHLGVRDVLDTGDDESNFARHQFVDFDRLRRERAQGFHLKDVPIRPQPDILPLAQPALEHSRQHHHAAIRIEPGIKQQRLKMALRRAFGRGDSLYNRLQHIRHTLAGFRADQQSIGGVQPHRALDHLFGARNVGALQVDLVDHRNNFEPVIDRQVGVRQSLRFDALRSVYHQQRPFAGS